MAKITIKRRGDYTRRDGTAAVYASFYIGMTHMRVPVELWVTKQEWDAARGRVKGRSRAAEDRNLVIEDVVARIHDILVRARLSGETLTRASFMNLYEHPIGSDTFVQFARRHLAETRSGLQWETIRHHSIAIKKFEEFKPDATFRDMTPELLRAYAKHLRDVRGNNPGTVGKSISILRVYMKAAIRGGVAKNNPFDSYKIPHSQPSIVFLTEDELNHLIALYKGDSLPDIEQDVLRFFLFMTFTGMHITDARMLQIEQIFAGEIHYRRIKTRTQVMMPLSAPAAKLVEYYKEGRTRGPLFVNLPTDQAVNRIIKTVCARVDIHKAVSAKAARHTFATLYYKKNGGDLGTLSRLLGHASISTTMIYAHIMKDNRMSGMAAFDDML